MPGLKFSNFSHDIFINYQQSGYSLRDTNVGVSLAPRLLVKTLGVVDRNQVKVFDPAIKNVTELYLGHGFNYFLIELNSIMEISSLIDSLNQQPSVLLVQPDLLQFKKNASAASLDIGMKNNQPYLTQLNIPKLWQHTKGGGVRLAIIDDGVDLNHPAFSKLKNKFSYDTQTHELSARPLTPMDSHGTQVAGVIFASQNNGQLQGIAPEAQLIAIRQPDSWTSNTLLAFQLASLAKADVINCSWNTQFLLEPVADVINDLTTYGRDGKGIAIVFSAGNEGVPITQMKTEATINSAITVGALDAQGAALASSNYGEGVDVSVYGAGVKSTANQGVYHQFSGTSLSAAIVSGLAALLISEEPNLSLNQLQQKIQQRTQLVAINSADTRITTTLIK